MGIQRKIALVSGTALMAFCQPAFAQDATPVPDTTTTQGAEASQDGGVGDIIVTASKREERLQDVPVSVTLVDGAQLTRQNINEVGDITRAAPALNTAGPFGALSIRGVGSLSFSRSSEGSVGVVVDGVALANTSANPPQLFDVARVEVLEGPQGTLFGRNSSAGVLNIVTIAPNPDAFEVIAHADVGSRDTYVGRATINLPIAGNAALRVSGAYNQAPENQYNRYNGSFLHSIGKSGRARFKWDPTADITINLIADYTQFDRQGGAPWTVYHSTPGSLLSQRLAACGVTVGQQNQDGCVDGGEQATTKTYGFSGQADMQIGGVTLTSISAYRAFKQTSTGSDADSVPINLLNRNQSLGDYRNFSQELRLTSRSGGFVEYVGGLYYFDGQLDTSNDQRGFLFRDVPVPGIGIPLPNVPFGQRVATTSSVTSVAAFGQATFNLTSALRVIAGARYGNEDVRAFTIGTPTPGGAAFAGVGTKRGKVSDTYFSYRLGAQFDLSDGIMLYGTYTKGYKGPSINDQSIGPNIPTIVRPEIPRASEIGIKTTLLNGRLAINLAGFYTKVTDFQAQFFDPGISQFVFGNAPSLKTKGVSLSVFGRPVHGLTLNLNALYNDAKYGDGYYVACAQLQTAANGCVVVPGTKTLADNAGGNRLAGSPKWKLTGSGEYEASLSDSLAAYVQADVVYTSRINFTANYDPLAANAPAAIFGGRIGLRTSDQRYGIAVFGRNLFDVYRASVRFPTSVAAQQKDPQSYSQISGTDSRRVIGLSLDAKF
ncbi:MAG: TonB-dependent receptor [Pseudomonadota bacterium]